MEGYAQVIQATKARLENRVKKLEKALVAAKKYIDISGHDPTSDPERQLAYEELLKALEVL